MSSITQRCTYVRLRMNTIHQLFNTYRITNNNDVDRPSLVISMCVCLCVCVLHFFFSFSVFSFPHFLILLSSSSGREREEEQPSQFVCVLYKPFLSFFSASMLQLFTEARMHYHLVVPFFSRFFSIRVFFVAAILLVLIILLSCLRCSCSTSVTVKRQ